MLVLRRGLVHDEVSDLVKHHQTLVLLRLQSHSTRSILFDLDGPFCDFLTLTVTSSGWCIHWVPAVLVSTEHLSALGTSVRIVKPTWDPTIKLYDDLVGTDSRVKRVRVIGYLLEVAIIILVRRVLLLSVIGLDLMLLVEILDVLQRVAIVFLGHGLALLCCIV